MIKKSDVQTFPTELHMLRFFGQYLPKLNVVASARLPLFMYVYDGQKVVQRGLHGFLTAMEELTGLGINTKVSAQRGPFFIIMFNNAIRQPKAFAAEDEVSMETGASPVSEPLVSLAITESVKEENPLVAQAKLLYNDSDKRSSKNSLDEFATSHGISLNKGKTFEDMITDFTAALEAKVQE